MAIVQIENQRAAGRRRIRCHSPVTLEPLGEFDICSDSDVQAAFVAARRAQPAWAATPVRERARYLTRALSILLRRQEEYLDVFVRESGKARIEALMMEIFAACDVLQYCAKHAPESLHAERRRLHGLLALTKSMEIHYRPVGVVGVISPWNGPFVLTLNPAVQALVAGNAVLLKPSEVTPQSGRLVGDLFREAGLPSGLLSVLTGDGSTGAALVNSGVDKICFTGSITTGRKVALACAERLVPFTLELGGKDPMIVCGDSDIDSAAAGAVAGAFFNTGQYCCGTERVYVVESIADAFIQRVIERTTQLRQSDSGEFDVGAIFWPEQLRIIEDHVKDAVDKGARILRGGRRNPKLKGLYFEPTVMTDVSHHMRVMREETFGPVLPIMKVANEDQAVQCANDSSYGLSANIWSRNTAKAIALAKRIDSGSVCINDMAMTYGALEAPFGGLKSSGIGQVNGTEGMRRFCHAQPIIVDRFGGFSAQNHYPYSRKKEEGLKKLIHFMWGTRLGRVFS